MTILGGDKGPRDWYPEKRHGGCALADAAIFFTHIPLDAHQL